MPRKPARPSLARRVTLLEGYTMEFLPRLHEKACEFVPRLKKTPLEDWCLYSGAAFFYTVAYSIANFVTPAQWKRIQPRYRALLQDFAGEFGDLQGEIAGVHQSVVALRARYAVYRTPESDMQDVIIQAGLWPLRRSLGWKEMPLKQVMPVSALGNLVWSHGAYWFDPARDPLEDLPGDEADFQMAILATLNRLARDKRIDAEKAPPA